eukprot:COSAG01_NODE_2771_length_7101_cov_12.982148_9_plen_85_part_00
MLLTAEKRITGILKMVEDEDWKEVGPIHRPDLSVQPVLHRGTACGCKRPVSRWVARACSECGVWLARWTGMIRRARHLLATAPQ